MNNKQLQIIKKEILKYLTEDFKDSQAIFDKKKGWQVFNGTDLEMVMDKVIRGLYSAKNIMDNKGVGQDMPKGTKFVIVAEEDYLRNIGIINERNKLGE